MGQFIQYATKESFYNGEFGGKAGWPAAGMGDVVVTDGGKLIAIDGGNQNDAEGFFALLKEKSPADNIIIDLWIITHPHNDHYGALYEISKNESLKNRITVKELVYFFPKEFKDENGNIGALEGVTAEIEKIRNIFGAKKHTPARDEVISADGTEIRFLYVPDDCSIFASSKMNRNHCSLIFSVEGNGKKVLITGDAYRPSLQITAFRYGHALKCDALQMPHHALCDSYCEDFYKYAAPDTVFMPISAAGYRAMHDSSYSGTGVSVNLALEDSAQTVYKAFDGTAKIDI